MAATHYPQRRYPPELRQRAVRMVFETIEAEGRSFGVITRIARQLDIGSESLRLWVRQAEVDRGERAGLTTDERARIAELQFRRLLVRFERRADMHEAFLMLGCCLICLRKLQAHSETSS